MPIWLLIESTDVYSIREPFFIKITSSNTFSMSDIKCVDKIITEMAVIEVTEDGLLLTEYNPEFTVEQIQEATEAKLIISDGLKAMC